MNCKNIRNIIFDLGGVIIDLDRSRAVEALTSLGLKNADTMLGLYIQQKPFLDIETGTIPAGRFFDDLRKEMNPCVTDSQITDAFNRFLVGLPAERLVMLRRLRAEGFKVYALSNTNPVMFHSWIQDAFRKEGLSTRDYFDGIVTSFEEGMCKPDVRLFGVPLRRYNLKPEETVMLDDSEKNCEAARKAGMRAIQITPEFDALHAVAEIEKCNL